MSVPARVIAGSRLGVAAPLKGKSHGRLASGQLLLLLLLLLASMRGALAGLLVITDMDSVVPMHGLVLRLVLALVHGLVSATVLLRGSSWESPRGSQSSEESVHGPLQQIEPGIHRAFDPLDIPLCAYLEVVELCF